MLDSARKVNYFSIRPSKKRKKDLHNNGIEPEIQSLLFIDWLLFFGWEFVASPSTHTPSFGTLLFIIIFISFENHRFNDLPVGFGFSSVIITKLL